MQPPSGSQQSQTALFRDWVIVWRPIERRPTATPRRLPPLPDLFNTNVKLATQATLGGDNLQQMMEETQMDAVSFAWDQIAS